MRAKRTSWAGTSLERKCLDHPQKIDESISHLCIICVSWINARLKMYVAVFINPLNGLNIQYCTNGKLLILVRLRLGKTVLKEEANSV